MPIGVHDNHQPGQPRSAERIELEQYPCMRCGAVRGESCTTVKGTQPMGSSLVHVNRRRQMDRENLG